jgi:hypothetical protein
VLALTMTATTAHAQMKTASEMYWDAVRASSGPIGFPQAAPDDPSRPIRPRRVFTPGSFAPLPYFVPAPEPVYVPVYVPVPIVYAPVPAEPAAPDAPRTSEPVTPAPRTPQKFYVIPGCYGGNRPPDPAALAPGCDVKKLRVSEW